MKDTLTFQKAFTEVNKYIESAPDVRAKAMSIKQRDFNDILIRNRTISSLNRKVYSDIISRLPEIAEALLSKQCHDTGLFTGLMGRAIWMYHYGHITDNPTALSDASSLFNNALSALPYSNADFKSGLSGIGWALVYLHSIEFIPYPEDALADICSHITAIILSKPLSAKCYGILAFACAAAFIPALRGFTEAHAPHFEKLCQEVLSSSHDVTSFFYAFLWLRIRKDGFDTVPPPLLTDWIKPSNFVASDQRFWSLSLYDGVGATSINTLLNYSIITTDNETQIQQIRSLPRNGR